MKKITSYLSLLPFLLLPFLMACGDDDEDGSSSGAAVVVNPSNFSTGVANYNYSVQVVPGNAAVEGKVSGIEGATVIISQGGNSETQSTVAGGMAHFSGVNAGTINGTVISDGYVTMNFTAEIMPVDLNSDSSQVINVSSTVTVFENNSELRGKVYGDYNVNRVPLDLNDPSNFLPTTVFINYHLVDYPMGAGNGALTNVNMELSTIYYTGLPSGDIRVSDIPGTVDGMLEARMYMQDIVVEEDPALPWVKLNIRPCDSTGWKLNLPPGEYQDFGYAEAVIYDGC